MINKLKEIKVRVNILRITEALEENKKRAHNDFIKATKKYQEDLLKRAKEAYGQILDGSYEEKVLPNFGLVEPIDVSDKYDELIKVFENVRGMYPNAPSTHDYLEMDIGQSNCIFNDEWDWSTAAKFANSNYIG